MSTVVITGASRGIGFATALVLARAGHSVVAAMRDPSNCPELSRVASTEDLPIRIEEMDVDSDASVAACFATILSRGPVDALVNNAGLGQFGSVEETALASFRACMETNYFGVLRCVQAVVRHMRERRRGTIVNVSSVAGQISLAPMTPYAASKFALEAASEGLAQEVTAFGVRVAIVQPGITDTRMAREIEAQQASVLYPHTRRLAAMFAASLANGAATPDIVAGKIREIIEGDTSHLRQPATPDARPFLSWRESMSDEQWIQWAAQDDDAWRASVKRDFGMEVVL